MRITELQIGSIQANDYVAADESTYGTRKLLLSDIIALAKAGLVPYDTEIELTSTEQQTARANIGAVALSDLPAGTTSAAGIVQLYDGTDSTATNKAATPNSVKAAYDLASGRASLTDGKVTPSEASSAYFSITENTALANANAGKTGLVGASVTLTFGTLDDGSEIELWNVGTYTVTISGTLFVSGNGLASSCTIDENSACVLKKMNNVIYVAGGITV